MSELPEASFAAVEASCRHAFGGEVALLAMRRLTAGANCETWSFDCAAGDAVHELVLRRRPPGRGRDAEFSSLGLDVERELLQVAASSGVPVPAVLGAVAGADGYLMQRLSGESLPQRILREARFARARRRLVAQCGQALARIHSIPLGQLPPGLDHQEPPEHVLGLRDLADRLGAASAVFELAFRWLLAHPVPRREARLVHGDFRNGNLMVDEQGLVGVLDWELAHLGDPHEDLGWLCLNSWRFGRGEFPVGGFGQVGELLAAYAGAGGSPPSRAALRYWMVFGTLRWGLICLDMTRSWRDGSDRSVERAVIGRRASEAEIDLLHLLDTDTITGD